MKPTQSEIDCAFEIAKQLVSYNFIKAISWETTKCGYKKLGFEDWCDLHSVDCSLWGIKLYRGASKAVIKVDKLSNWVLKVNFINYEGRNIDNIDYCAKETRFYQKAIEENIESYFAAEYYLGQVDNIDFYVQEAVDADEDSISSRFYEYCASDYEPWEDESEEEISYGIEDAINDMNDEERIYALYNYAIADKLVSFMDKYHINDLHAGNWGYRADGQIVVFDYSGY